jgi:hypothetical protein
MAKAPKLPKLPKPPKPPDPSKAVSPIPRLRAVSPRNYGKGGTPLFGDPDMGIRGAGVGYGGPKNGV